MEILEAIEDFISSNYEEDAYDSADRLLEKNRHRFGYHHLAKNEYVVYVPERKRDEEIHVSVNIESGYLRMECPHPACRKVHGACQHALAAALYLEGELDEDFFDDDDEERGNGNAVASLPAKDTASGYSTFNMGSIETHTILKLCGNSKNALNGNFYRKVAPVHTSGKHQQFHFIEKNKKAFAIDIIYDGKTTFKTRCTCGQEQYLLCDHVAACFFYLLYTEGAAYFRQFYDFTEEKNQFLKPYGLTMDDPEASHFKWEVTWQGSLILKEVPSFLVPVGANDFYEDFRRSIPGAESLAPGHALQPSLPDDVMIDYEVGFVLNFSTSRGFGFELETSFVREKAGRQVLKKLSIQTESNWPYLQALPGEVYDALLGFYEKNLLKWLEANGGSRLSSVYNPWNYLRKGDHAIIRKRQYSLVQELWSYLEEWPYVYVLKEGNFNNKNVTPARLGKESVHLMFIVEADNRFITVYCTAHLEGISIHDSKISVWRNLLFEIDNKFYLPASADYLPLLEKFQDGMIKFPASEIRDVVQHVIAPLQAKYKVETRGLPQVAFISTGPQPRVMLSELNDQFLMFRPQFLYDDVVVNYDTGSGFVDESDEKLKVITRDKHEEKKLYEFLRSLHPKFSNQRNNLYYYLSFKEVMVNNWFLHAVKQIQHAGYPVYGLQELKKFKYNTNSAKFDIKAGSGVDWFDLKINVSWGDQHVNTADIRKAIINNQNTVLLGDGTLGLIPQEWLKQYAPLMKMTTMEEGSLRISKLHFTLLDDIDSYIDSEEVKSEIAEKKRRLLAYDTIQTVPPSSQIKAALRPYQVSGVNWLQILDNLGWGGCLADDMGLGKTLQAITFLQYLKEKNSGGTHLVICPTSLIFNWESELRKFCPSLECHTYYGIQRSFNDEHFEQFDIVLTTYGMVRNDLDHLLRFGWHYIILDESQAIKNPEALTTRAVQKLKARNKIILSGTPIQNNTQDLYAQFTFLNPGLLGNREFFKTEFAGPIDGHGDKEKTAQLRRLLYPFILRRTKEQVATDLPDKTEVVLWCAMEKEQRQVYDRYKEYYRQLLLEKIDTEGMAKAGIYVLEGLLRLRQICDHPALLKDENIRVKSAVKTEELMREIQENASGHKLLVFSQFTEMLTIIRTMLVNAGIKYCYLDGSTPANQRKQQVEQFQADESIKIFLISLKAGGVGLNLTAADYVYLVDPWWNPAAEQQAIDRTHRIGQMRKIFAYKMICKDSVEEKILQLQEKKKLLASELISEDSGFVKKLTRDDIEYLFS